MRTEAGQIDQEAGAAGTQVVLLGLDFGSTTSGVLAATAEVGLNCATGRMEFGAARPFYRSDPVFTPFRDDGLIDIPALAARLDRWIADSGVRRDEIFAGGAIVTGLAAERRNAGELARLVRARIGDAVVATADDPMLESWLAFMGSCAGLSKLDPGRDVLNLDIGGGTTNPALGADGRVIATGCHHVGARHFRFDPGTYRLAGLSGTGAALLDHLGIAAAPGDELPAAAVGRIVGFYVAALEAIAGDDRAFFETPIGRLHERAPFRPPASGRARDVTFSGGVGELLYRHAAGLGLPSTTAFGDLGVDLARGIAASPLLSRALRRLVPENRGRATVYGLTLHSTQVSGATVFLPDPSILPLTDLPVLAALPATAAPEAVAAALALAARSRAGACLHVTAPGRLSLGDVRALGGRLAAALDRLPADEGGPIVLLLDQNAGKVLGQYAGGFGARRTRLVVIDEVPARDARFVTVGRPRGGVLPVSFYGLT